MTPIQNAFLKDGWVQVGGADIPVFFRLTGDKQYPYQIIFTTDDYAYYRIYNEWVHDGKMSAYKINLEPLIRSAYEHTYTNEKMFNIAINAAVSDFYYYKVDTDNMNNYHFIEQFLKQQKIEECNQQTETTTMYSRLINRVSKIGANLRRWSGI